MNDTTKPFSSLSTMEVAKLTQEQILGYSKIVGEDHVLSEVFKCRAILRDMGINL